MILRSVTNCPNCKVSWAGEWDKCGFCGASMNPKTQIKKRIPERIYDDPRLFDTRPDMSTANPVGGY